MGSCRLPIELTSGHIVTRIVFVLLSSAVSVPKEILLKRGACGERAKNFMVDHSHLSNSFFIHLLLLADLIDHLLDAPFGLREAISQSGGRSEGGAIGGAVEVVLAVVVLTLLSCGEDGGVLDEVTLLGGGEGSVEHLYYYILFGDITI